MAAIYLVRHGQASFAADNYDQLSEVGVQQATLLGKDFAARLPMPDAVFSGSMMRHQQTQKNVMAQQNSAMTGSISLPCWNEFDHQQILAAYNSDFATPQGVKLFLVGQQQPEKAFMTLFQAAIERWLSGSYDNYQESWVSFRQRVELGLNQLCQQIESQQLKNVFVFTSGGPISVVLMQQLGLPVSSLMQANKMLVNCGVTKLLVSKGKVHLSSSNEHSLFDSLEHRHLITYK